MRARVCTMSADLQRTATCLLCARAQKLRTSGRTLHNDAQEREQQRHFGAVGLRELPFVLLHLAMRLFRGQRVALRSELLDVRLHQAGICDPVGHGDHSCDDRKAEERGVGCCDASLGAFNSPRSSRLKTMPSVIRFASAVKMEKTSWPASVSNITMIVCR